MERLVKKYEQRYKRANECVARWNTSQGKLLGLFSNAAAVIQRFPLLLSRDCFEELEGRDDLVGKQAESLEKILSIMRETLLDLEDVCKDFEKLWRDAANLLKNEKPKPTRQQVQQRFGSRPSLEDCVSGLKDLYAMHRDEYALKADIISSLTYDTKANDIVAMQTVLADQPNLPPDEVETIFNMVFAGGGR
ncbi:uncharacterized protein At5g43822-like [Selaginella moellendorffii]|uniref:uncharacterized protein At5g43822-like n=1 Tax=Selaginella moellendorffii TaxID=88036 RepID=UPI000D1CDCE2|nr:uncharacterized protein At5g43822-like [Selaginella moellendorffii]XP_024514929.1 uncharacterized protein At5g43822-like [Selaginella moellendorffii]|eukprot:XP_024514928.1 uncharacterized protein At5g43822-like [Selaginella moellendorffii]